MRNSLAALVGLASLVGHAATFTGDLYAYWYDDSESCGLYRVEEAWKNSPEWRSDYVEVDGKKEPALFGWDCYAIPVTISAGETFSAAVIHGTSTAAHIKSLTVLTDAQMLARFKDSEEWNEDSASASSMRELWNDGAKATRAWIVVEQNNVTSGATYSLNLAEWPIVDGDGSLSSTATITSYAKQFGVTLSGTRKVTVSVWYRVGIQGGAAFPERLWNICDPFAKDGSTMDKLLDKGGDEERYDAPGLFFVTPDMVGGGSSGGTVAESWKKARTLRGAATRALPNPVVGIFELKCGKANKKGVAKVSATLTGIDGKKTKYKARSVHVGGETVTVDFGGLSITIAADGTFSGDEGVLGGLGVASAGVGGNWTRAEAGVHVDFNEGKSLPADVLEDLLPDGEPVLAKGGKWAFNKAASVKLSKDKTQAVWDTSKGRTNLSAMKLSYMPKTGIFKGSFKVYALASTSGGKKKMKKYTATVTGVVVDGRGYGQATIKKPAGGPWPVSVE